MTSQELLSTINHAGQLARRLASGEATVAVVGLGYVGLSLAVALARAGLRVLGIEADPERAALVNRGDSYIGDVSSEDLAALVASGTLHAGTAFDVAAEADAIVICVPTPLRKTREPDMSFIVAALDHLVPFLHADQLVVLESTTYPGTTEEIVQPRLESRGFRVGTDIFLAFSPERVDPGNRRFTTADIPKVVGGVTPVCTGIAATLYAKITGSVHRVSSPKVAETAKLLENTFRSVNIALANELALGCRAIGVNPWEVIEAAATKPFGFMAFHPGPGTGGHCIPLDPLYFSWKLRLNGFETRFVALADDINRAMPRHVVDLLVDGLNDRGRCLRGATVLVAGVTYKRDVGDIRESPALEIIRLVLDKGAHVTYSDPYVPELLLDGLKVTPEPLTPETLRARDAVLLVTDHTLFDRDAIAREARLVVDVRNALASTIDRANIRTF